MELLHIIANRKTTSLQRVAELDADATGKPSARYSMEMFTYFPKCFPPIASRYSIQICITRREARAHQCSPSFVSLHRGKAVSLRMVLLNVIMRRFFFK